MCKKPLGNNACSLSIINLTFAFLRPRPAFELCGGGVKTTESWLWITVHSGWWVTPLVTGAVFKDESKKGFLAEGSGPESLPSIIVIVPPWVILPPSGHCPLLRARIMDLLDKSFICWLRTSESSFKQPLIIVLLVLSAVLFRWLLMRKICELLGADRVGNWERGSSLKGSLSGVGK